MDTHQPVLVSSQEPLPHSNFQAPAPPPPPPQMIPPAPPPPNTPYLGHFPAPHGASLQAEADSNMEIYGTDLTILGKRHMDDDGGVKKKKKGSLVRPQVAGRRRARKMFTDQEVANLVKGVEEFGEGKWSKILEEYTFDDRTSVDLKDKWRNLQKPSSTVKVPKDRRPRLPYSEEECGELRRGVQMYGHNWVTILRKFKFNPERTPVDLKDKWRNMQMKSGAIPPPQRKPRRFLLLDADDQIFRNVYPRDAALKAATRGYEYIRLLQIGTPRIHVFAGERERVDAPSIRKFRGAQNGQIWKGRVLKLGMERATVHQLSKAKASVSQHLGKEVAHDIAPNIPTPDTSHLNDGDHDAMMEDVVEEPNGNGNEYYYDDDDEYAYDGTGGGGGGAGGGFSHPSYYDGNEQRYAEPRDTQKFDILPYEQSLQNESIVVGQTLQNSSSPFSNQNYHNGQPSSAQVSRSQSISLRSSDKPPPPPPLPGTGMSSMGRVNTGGRSLSSPPAPGRHSGIPKPPRAPLHIRPGTVAGTIVNGMHLPVTVPIPLSSIQLGIPPPPRHPMPPPLTQNHNQNHIPPAPMAPSSSRRMVPTPQPLPLPVPMSSSGGILAQPRASMIKQLPEELEKPRFMNTPSGIGGPSSPMSSSCAGVVTKGSPRTSSLTPSPPQLAITAK